MNNHSIPQTPKRAILYARVSGDDRKNATSSIEGQLAECRKYAEQHSYQIVQEVFEEPERKTSGDAWLPEMEKIVRQAAIAAFDVLIVREMDRFARNRLKQMLLENDLKHKGIRVEYVIGQYEDTPEGDLLKGLVAEVAEYERKKITERVQRGKLRAIQAGNVATGGLSQPYGYDLVQVLDPITSKERRTLAINEAEATIVRLIFDLYANQLCSRKEICEHLKTHQVLRPGKGAAHRKQAKRNEWSLGTLNHILNNETYTGFWHYRKSEFTKNEQTGKTERKDRPREEWLAVEVPAIISPALFAAAQARRAQNKRQKSRQRKHEYTLGGMLQCGQCGSHISGTTKYNGGKPYRYYRCNAFHSPIHYGFRCPSSSYRAEPLEQKMWVWAKGLLLDPEVRAKGIEDARAREREQLQPKVAMLANGRVELDALNAQVKRWEDAYEIGDIGREKFREKSNPLYEKIKNLELAIGMEEKEIEIQQMTPEVEEKLNSLAEEVQANIEYYDRDPQAQRRVFRQLNMQGKLIRADDHVWAECECLLGREKLPVEFKSNIAFESYCTFFARLCIA